MKSTKLINSIIVLATVLTVVGPVVSSQFFEEIARWHLAAAANADELGIGDREESLRKAKEASADLFGLRDYWLILLQQTLDNNPAKIPELIRFAKTKDPNLARLGTLAVSALEAEGNYELAVRVLEESLTPEARGLRVNLNYLAYMRSLAGIELEQARNDINQALKVSPNDPALRDTRAWVLFKLGNYEDALEDADFAVKETARRRLPNPLRFLESWGSESVVVSQDSQGAQAEPPQEDISQSDAQPAETQDLAPASDQASSDQASSDQASSDQAVDAEQKAGAQAVAETESSAQVDDEDGADNDSTDASADAADIQTLQRELPKTVSMQTYQEGVLRYHRGRILEKLGRQEEMEQDWEWLRQHNLPINDSLR